MIPISAVTTVSGFTFRTWKGPINLQIRLLQFTLAKFSMTRCNCDLTWKVRDDLFSILKPEWFSLFSSKFIPYHYCTAVYCGLMLVFILLILSNKDCRNFRVAIIIHFGGLISSSIECWSSRLSCVNIWRGMGRYLSSWAFACYKHAPQIIRSSPNCVGAPLPYDAIGQIMTSCTLHFFICQVCKLQEVAVRPFTKGPTIKMWKFCS